MKAVKAESLGSSQFVEEAARHAEESRRKGLHSDEIAVVALHGEAQRLIREIAKRDGVREEEVIELAVRAYHSRGKG